MKYMYALLFVLAASPALASVYATEEAAEEGTNRGKPLGADKDGFVRGVGFLKIESPDMAEDDPFKNANAILISPQKVLICAHALRKSNPSSIAVIFHPDFIEFSRRFTVEMADGTADRAPYGESILDTYGMLDLRTIIFHPTLDLAIVSLKMPMPHIPIISLLLEKPDRLINGFLVSYADISTLQGGHAETRGKRHISVLDVKEGPVPSSGDPQIYWTKEWDIPAGLDVRDSRSHIFTPCAADHRLTAYGQPGDSGAPFVMKRDGAYYVAGIYIGKSIVLEGDRVVAMAAAAGGRVAGLESLKQRPISKIIPLYLAADWIRAQIAR